MEITGTQAKVKACFSFIDYVFWKRSSLVKETLEAIKSIPQIEVEKNKSPLPFLMVIINSGAPWLLFH